LDTELWSSVDSWFAAQLIETDAALDHALSESARAGLRPINVSRTQGKLLHLIARMIGARNVLEVGTLGGYSSIWMARALPEDGRLITLEIDPNTAEIARLNFAFAGLNSMIEVRVGAAVDSLRQIATEELPPFDLVFIDADKESNPDYFEWALNLTHTGSVILIDNVVRRGRVIDRNDTESDMIGVRRVTEMVAAESRVTSTVMQTVGEKGYDGLLVALVTG
jgi:predicted O-methyltransferase YrrM